MPSPLPHTLPLTLSTLTSHLTHTLLPSSLHLPPPTDAHTLISLTTLSHHHASLAAISLPPYHILLAKKALEGRPHTHISAIIGAPHGGSTTEVKCFEARRAIAEGAAECEVLVNLGRVRSGKWAFVEKEVAVLQRVVSGVGGLLRLVLGCEFLTDVEIIQLCEISSRVGVAFVQTSTGYGFVPQADEDRDLRATTVRQVQLMRRHLTGDVRIVVVGGVSSLDDVLGMLGLGVERVGTSATVSILEEAARRGIGDEVVEVKVPSFEESWGEGQGIRVRKT